MFGILEGRVLAAVLSIQSDDDGLDAVTRSLLVISLVFWDKLLLRLGADRRPGRCAHGLLCRAGDAENGGLFFRSRQQKRKIW